MSHMIKDIWAWLWTPLVYATFILFALVCMIAFGVNKTDTIMKAMKDGINATANKIPGFHDG